MPQSIELPRELVDAARHAAESSDRSTNEQIEFWVGLGRCIEPMLSDERISALCESLERRHSESEGQ